MKRVVLAALPLLTGCGGSGEPAKPPDLGVLIPACGPAAAQVALLTNGAISCAQDAGPCDLKAERNLAIDKLAECLKALP